MTIDNLTAFIPQGENEGAGTDAMHETGAITAVEPESGRCRTNSRRGVIDPERRSYPPVEAVCKAFSVLRAVNRVRIATINNIYAETGIPKSTIVRMLETLMAEGYVTRDNMCGGYRITRRVEDLHSGYDDISRVIEVARPLAIGLTRRKKWPIGLGAIDGDAINIQFWTGAISPWAHTSTVLGLRPDLLSSSMGRAYLAFCPQDEFDDYMKRFRADPERNFGEPEEYRFRLIIDRIRTDGYATRDPQTRPYRTTTLAMPIFEEAKVQALISISFFKTAVAKHRIGEEIVAPLRNTKTAIEDSLSFHNTHRDAHSGAAADDENLENFELGF